MATLFPQVRVGDPVRCDGLSVFPLFTAGGTGVEYALSDEALREGKLNVNEVSESGSVPELLVQNEGDVRVLLIEGEELVGAKQNRVLNTSILVAAHTKTKIPVSCVEQGRWGYKSREFGSSGMCTPSKLRHLLKFSVGRSLKAKRGHRSDQSAVWKEVDRQQAALGASSGTSAMSDTFAAHQKRLEEFRQTLQYVDGATGAAVAVGDRVVACDLFDKPATCQKVWDRLLSGYVLDALESQEQKEPPLSVDVERFVGDWSDLSWESVDAVGEGNEYRAERESGDHASALSLDDVLVHGSLVAQQ